MTTQNVANFVLLGYDGSGKTTIFKQIKEFCGDNPLRPDELQSSLRSCVQHAISAMQLLIEQSKILTSRGVRGLQISPGISSFAQTVAAVNVETLRGKEFDNSFADQFMNLWSDPGIQKTYLARLSRFHFPSQGQYFIEKFTQFVQPTYTANFNDYIRLSRESGVRYETAKLSETWSLRMTDLCGQKSARRNWFDYFDSDFTVVCFICSLSDYCHLLDDGRTNRLHDSLELFKSVCRLECFAQAYFMVFLNKKDEYDNLLAHIPFTMFEPSYSADPTDTTQTVEYIKNAFTKRLPSDKTNRARFYVTTAVETDSFEYVLDAMTQEIIHLEQKRRVDKALAADAH